MSERGAMLMAVLASPADDLPRLVYADWLDEKGSGYDHVIAEFIRVQCELARLGVTGDPIGDKRAAVRATGFRERALWQEYGSSGYVIRPPDMIPFRKLLYVDWRTNQSTAVSQAEYRRGFVAEIRLPMASLMGSECERCNGSGRVRYYHPVEIEGVDDCPACVGEPFPGRVGGAMRGIFRTHPVTAVRLTDKSPEEVGAGWSWFAEGFADDPATLPHGVFDLLGGDYDVSMLGQRVTYPTRLAAQDALSDAIVRHGRAVAGVADQLPTEDAKC